VHGAPTFFRSTPAPASANVAPLSNGPAPTRLFIRPGLIILPSASVTRSLWVFRAPKLVLPKD
jgi:hypothetical protein